MADANAGHVQSYGDDPWTGRPPTCSARCSRPTARCSSSSTARRPTRWRWPRCASPTTASSATRLAHVETDECGAPEFFSNGDEGPALPTGRTARSTRPAVERAVRRRTRHPLPQAARGEPHPGHRARHGLLARRGQGDLGAVAKSHGLRSAHGRRALRQRRGVARLHAEGDHLAGRAWTCSASAATKNGMARGRGGGVLQPRAGPRVRLPLQAGRPARLQDALPLRALGRDARGRRLAPARPPRQRHGRAAARPRPRDPRGRDALPAPGQLRLRRAAAGRERRLHARGWHFYTFIG